MKNDVPVSQIFQILIFQISHIFTNLLGSHSIIFDRKFSYLARALVEYRTEKCAFLRNNRKFAKRVESVKSEYWKFGNNNYQKLQGILTPESPQDSPKIIHPGKITPDFTPEIDIVEMWPYYNINVTPKIRVT